MLTEYDIYLYAAAHGWQTTIDFLHTQEGICGVFLSRGTHTILLGPLKAIQTMSCGQFLAYLERLEEEEQQRANN